LFTFMNSNSLWPKWRDYGTHSIASRARGPYCGRMQARSPFDPTDFNFILLQDFRIPGDVSVYELQNHRIVDGRKDFLRLNVYLTKDHNYVTIWRGLLDLLLTEAEFESGRMANQIGRQRREAIVKVLSPAVFDRHVPALDIAGFAQALVERDQAARPLGRRFAAENPRSPASPAAAARAPRAAMLPLRHQAG
jgi:hypothetical protein